MSAECNHVLREEGEEVVAAQILRKVKEKIQNRVSLQDDPGYIINEDAGYVEGLEDVEQDGAVLSECSEAGVLQLQIPMVFKNLRGNYSWKTKGLPLSGDHRFTIEKVTLRGHFSVLPVTQANALELDTVEDFVISGIKKEITGMGFLNSFVSRLSSFYGNNVSRAWRRLLQPALEDALKTAAKQTSVTFASLESNNV